MNAKATIRKIIFIAVWLCIGGGMVTLLLAAISSKRNGHCTDLVITVRAPENTVFIKEKEIQDILEKSGRGPLKGQLISSLNLNEMEETLEKTDWVSKAELFIDSRDVLHVVIMQKTPVARIFTGEESSFYIDAEGTRMPLSDSRSAKVPVFTGFPGKKNYSAADSQLLVQVKSVATYILNHPFWMAQVAQISITPDRNMELIPVVGNHIVRLGEGEQIEAKFNRLMQFYRQVLSKSGFDRYKLIDVRFKGQVVASRYAGDPKVDSIALKKNVEKLLKYAEESAKDTVVRILPPVVTLEKDSIQFKKEDLPDERTSNPEKKTDPNPRLDDNAPALRQPADGGQAVKTGVKKADQTGDKKTESDKKRKPKAVMPKKPEIPEEHGYN